MGFGAVDYAIFGLSLAMSGAVGVFYSIRGVSGSGEFFMGNRKMPIVPTMLSLLTSFTSGISILAVPADVYIRGLGIWAYGTLGGALGIALSGFVFLPKLYRMQTTSVYEYFRHRFDSEFLRRFGSALFVITVLFYMAVVIYGPAIALSALTGLPLWMFIAIIGLVCTFYTTVGGLKAVVWTDTLQAGFMFGGVIILAYKGCVNVGGISEVISRSIAGGRIQPLTNFNPNPVQYISIPVAIIAGAATNMGVYGLSQISLQRYASLPTLNQARLVVLLILPCFLIFSTVCSFLGLVMYAHYQNCDPLTALNAKPDELVMRFAADTLSDVPGLAGLFLATLCSATLSTVSSGINSLSAVTWEDFLKHKLQRQLSERWQNAMPKLLALLYGLTSIVLAFLCEPIGGMLKLVVNIVGCFVGPIVGIFALGFFVKPANKWGATVGIMLATVIIWWINLGNVFLRPYKGYHLVLNGTCSNSTIDSALVYSEFSIFGDPNVFAPYRICAYLYPFIGMTLSFLIGWIVSLLFGQFKKPSLRIAPEPELHLTVVRF